MIIRKRNKVADEGRWDRFDRQSLNSEKVCVNLGPDLLQYILVSRVAKIKALEMVAAQAELMTILNKI